MKLKRFSLVLTTVLLITGAMLAGCGNKASNNSASGNTGTTQSSSSNNKSTSGASGSSGVSGSIVALGSSALQPLAEDAAKAYMAKNPKAQIQVQGGGSGTGLSQVAGGGADIGDSDIFAEEKSGIDASKLVDHKVAVVGMGPVINPKNKVDSVTQQQLIDIFTGKITNWKQVGGADQKIVLINRPKSSGTRATFYNFALQKHEEKDGITEDSSGTVRKLVAQKAGAIAYEAFSYFDGTIKPLKIDGIAPTAANVATNKWKVWAYEHMYTKGKATGLAADFLKYMVSDAVQGSMVKKDGYLPVTAMKVVRDAKGNVTKK